MRETHRRGRKSTSRAARRLDEPTQEQPGGPLADAQPPIPPQTIKIPTAQQLQQAQARAAEAALQHAVDTDHTVQEAYAPRRRRSDRHKRSRPQRRSPVGIAARALAVLIVLAATGFIVSHSPLIGVVPGGLAGFTQPAATPSAQPTPRPAPTATPVTVDYGKSIVILDGLSADDPAFGDAFEGQLQHFGKLNNIPARYVRCDATGVDGEYAKLLSTGEAPVIVFGPYESLLALAAGMSDLKDAGTQLGLSSKMLALGPDSRVLPLSVRFDGVFVRKSLWHGELPRSYDELLAGARALGGNAPQSFPLGLPLGSPAGEAFCRDMLSAYGADLSNPSSCNPQDIAQVLLWFQQAFDDRLAPTDSVYWDQTQARSAISGDVSAVSAGDDMLLQGLDSAAAADLVLLPPLQGPKGRSCTAQLMGMAMPRAANPQAAQKLLNLYVIGPHLLDQAMAGEQGYALPAPQDLLKATDPARNPWARWLDQMDGVTLRADGAASARTVCQAISAVALGGYTPDEAAAWLLAK